jgi:tRNA (cmo5U34)-methyltransferase
MEEVKKAFDEGASRYDAQRRLIIPDFDGFYGAAIWAVAWPGSTPSVLDIGAGTGLLSQRILERYPESTLTLLDISENMLDMARHRFMARSNIRFLVMDYSREDFLEKYDIVISALSIHHLSASDKKDLYRRIFTTLNKGGVFVNAEQVQGETTWMHCRNIEYWDMFIQQSGLSQEEIGQVRLRRDTYDRMEKLSIQLQWLRDIGYSDVDVVYKNRPFAVFCGRKAVLDI